MIRAGAGPYLIFRQQIDWTRNDLMLHRDAEMALKDARRRLRQYGGKLSDDARRFVEQTIAELASALQAGPPRRVNDALTGVLNRRGLELMAEPMIELSRRRGEAVHALFVDVDGFALVNDELGYARGDEVLVAVAEALVGSCRTTDVVCRVGGDEFVVLGPGTGTSPLELERRMREILRAAPPVEESVWPARLSIGSATLVPWDDGDLSSLLGRADSDMRLRRSLRRQSVDRRDRTGDISPREV